MRNEINAVASILSKYGIPMNLTFYFILFYFFNLKIAVVYMTMMLKMATKSIYLSRKQQNQNHSHWSKTSGIN